MNQDYQGEAAPSNPRRAPRSEPRNTRNTRNGRGTTSKLIMGQETHPILEACFAPSSASGRPLLIVILISPSVSQVFLFRVFRVFRGCSCLARMKAAVSV